MSGELSAGQAFGGYHIVELVGSGGMGLVYRAEQRILGRTVALKVIRPEIAESGDYRERFLREARFAAAVDDPHVVSVFDAGEQEGRLYLAMQWVDGPDLGTVIDRQQRLAPARGVRTSGCSWRSHARRSSPPGCCTGTSSRQPCSSATSAAATTPISPTSASRKRLPHKTASHAQAR